MKTTAVIMAGGRGERFWPRSRTNHPKQFLSLTEDGKTLIQLTVERLLPLVDIEDIFIVTNQNYADLVQKQIPNVPSENIIFEPCARNTAPCIGLAAAIIEKKYEDSVMLVLPADHIIHQQQLYISTLNIAIDIALKDANLVTIGIAPTYPETGYGYIRFGKQMLDSKHDNVYNVEEFVEKPNLEKAKEYLDAENYLWNSGMFTWKTSSIMRQFELYAKDTFDGLQLIKKSVGCENFNDVLNKVFSEFKSESIDYAIMEKAENIYTLPGTFTWDDVGSWLALERLHKPDADGNVVTGNVATVDTKHSIIEGSEKLIATVGLENVVIVDTDDAILICTKDSTTNIKKILEKLRNNNKTEYM